MQRLNTDKKILRKFGITMGIAFVAITLIIFIRHGQVSRSFSMLSAAFLAFALALPMILKPLYIFWMGLAFVLSWINTRLILITVFYLVITPIALLIRLSGRDFLDRKLERDRGSYWKAKEGSSQGLAGYEKRF